MSAPLAGKFQDHYEVLGLSPRATLEEIEQVCQQLSEKYDPVMGTEPDLEQFEGVKLALEVLSDPDLRAQFDKLKGIEEKPPQFTGLPFFEGLGEDSRLRTALLCVLFDRRRSHPVKPTLNMRQIERIIDADSESFILATWYLKQRGMITVNDKSHLEITVKGIDELEGNPPDPEMVIGMIRPEGLAGYEPPEAEEQEAVSDAQSPEAEAQLSMDQAEPPQAEAEAPQAEVQPAPAQPVPLQAQEVPAETSALEAETVEEPTESAPEPAAAESGVGESEGTESNAPAEVELEGLQALAGATSEDAGPSPAPAGSEQESVQSSKAAREPVTASAGKRFRLSRSAEILAAARQNPASSPAASEETSAEPADESQEASNWSVSTPLGDSSNSGQDSTQTVGGRLQGILGRPRIR